MLHQLESKDRLLCENQVNIHNIVFYSPQKSGQNSSESHILTTFLENLDNYKISYKSFDIFHS